MMRKPSSTMVGYAAIGLAAALLFGVHTTYSAQEYDVARNHFIQSRKADAEREALKAEAAFRSIYENIRTIARLPSVINIDRHASNIDADDKAWLDREAKREGVPMTRLVQRAIARLRKQAEADPAGRHCS